MRSLAFLLALIAFANTAAAWEFTPGTPCLLTHEASDVAIELTYDPTGPLYSISLTQATAFVPAPVFSMTFGGTTPLTISTGTHRLNDANRTLTVTDRGFGNVLNGLQFGTEVRATLGDQVIMFPLINASEAVAAFRACDVLPST
ncbi:MAG: hypothetical protein AB8B60_18630 [Sulfitobacter sp.]